MIGGLDLQENGSWIAVNDSHVLAILLNRPAPGPRPSGFRTRGELPLLALEQKSASAAADTILGLDARRWRPFNLVLADRHEAIWIRGEKTMGHQKFPTGLSLLSNGDLNADSHARIRKYRPLFRNAAVPDPDHGRWNAWMTLLGDAPAAAETPDTGMLVRKDSRGFGTMSSAVVAIPANPAVPIVWHFAAGPPDRTPFAPVPCDWKVDAGPASR